MRRYLCMHEETSQSLSYLVSATRTSQLVLACMLNNSHSMLLRYAVEYGPRSGSCQPIGGISARREESSGAAAGKRGQRRLDQACKVAVLQAQRVRVRTRLDDG